MNSKEKAKIITDTLKNFLDMCPIKSANDKKYAAGLVVFYMKKGRLSEKQITIGRKLAVRLIVGHTL